MKKETKKEKKIRKKKITTLHDLGVKNCAVCGKPIIDAQKIGEFEPYFVLAFHGEHFNDMPEDELINYILAKLRTNN